MSDKADKWTLACYLIAFVVIASTLAIFQPLGNNDLRLNPPDEHARFLVPYYISQHGTLPTGFEEEVRIPSYGFSYALYNVFPYIVQGYVMWFVGFFTDSLQALLYAGRFVNVAAGLAMAWVVYLLSRRFFTDKGVSWMFCFVVTFLPQNLFVHTYINSDSMCMLSTAMMLLALVWAYQEGFDWKNCALLAGGIIICALSYYNAYGYILSSILLFLAYFAPERFARGKASEGSNGEESSEGPGRRKSSEGYVGGKKWEYAWKPMLQKGFFIAGLVLLGIGWWFIRSYLLFDGDFLGLSTREGMAIRYAIPQVNPLATFSVRDSGTSLWEMLTQDDYLSVVFFSFVGMFGSLSLSANVWLYRVFLLFFAAGLLGCLFSNGSATKRSWKRIFFHCNMIFCILMPLYLMIYYSYTMDYQSQGRYILPSLIPFAYYVTRGWQKIMESRRFPRKLRPWLIAAVMLLLAGTCAYLTYVVSLPLYLENGLSLEGL